MYQHSKKEKIQRILSGEIFIESPIVERNALAALAQRGDPNTKLSSYFILVVLPFIVGMAIFSVLAFLFVNSTIIESYPELAERRYFILAAVLSVVALLWFLAHDANRRKLIRGYVNSMNEPVSEVYAIKQYLEDYLGDLDKRTSRYFHCVTNSKVTNYFVLRQIRDALELKLNQIEEALDVGSLDAYLLAHRTLRESLEFSDGVIAGKGNQHSIPFARLNSTISFVVQDLEVGLNQLESELATARSGYTDLTRPVG